MPSSLDRPLQHLKYNLSSLLISDVKVSVTYLAPLARQRMTLLSCDGHLIVFHKPRWVQIGSRSAHYSIKIPCRCSNWAVLRVIVRPGLPGTCGTRTLTAVCTVACRHHRAAVLLVRAIAAGGHQSAAAATQAVLEWPRLCRHVAQFASTTMGRQAVLSMQASLPSLMRHPGHCRRALPSQVRSTRAWSAKGCCSASL